MATVERTFTQIGVASIEFTDKIPAASTSHVRDELTSKARTPRTGNQRQDGVCLTDPLTPSRPSTNPAGISTLGARTVADLVSLSRWLTAPTHRHPR